MNSRLHISKFAGGFCLERNHISKSKDIIKKCVDLQNQIQIFRDDTGNREITSPMITNLNSWANEYKNITQEFFRNCWTAVRTSMMDGDENLEDWIKDACRTWNKASPKHKNYVAHIPFLNIYHDEKGKKVQQDIEKIYDKLDTFLIHKIGKGKISFIQEIIHEIHFFEHLTDSKSRKDIYHLKNVNHFTDYTSSIQIISTAEQIFHFSSEDDSLKSDKFIVDLTLIMLFLHMLSENNYVVDDSSRDDWTKLMTEFRVARSDTTIVKRANSIKERIKTLNWGPKYYVRNPNHLEDLVRDLNVNGVVALTGFGGVGKTAMATQLIHDAVSEGHFKKYILSSCKVNSKQKELNIHSKTGPSHLDTNKKTSIFNTLLGDDGSIFGSIRRLCRQIIKAANHNKQHYISEMNNEALITIALDCLKTNKMLICIDNFEDIEDPDKEHIKDVEIRDKIGNEYNSFQEFFKRWTNTYRKLKEEMDKPSQIIITTRGSGYGDYGRYAVPYLSEKENFDLFKTKIQHRIDSGEETNFGNVIIPNIDQEWKQDIMNEFSNYRILDKEMRDIQGYHPMNTIYAAAWVNENSKHDILKAVKKWDPKGNEAKLIHQYTTSRILKGYSDLHTRIIITLANRHSNKQFRLQDLIDIANDESFQHKEAYDFIMRFSTLVDWFVRGNNDRYMWRHEIYLAVNSSEKFKELAPSINAHIDDEKETIESNVTTYSIDDQIEYCKPFFEWLSIKNLNTVFSENDDLRTRKNILKMDLKEAMESIIKLRSISDEKLIAKLYCSIFDSKLGIQHGLLGKNQIKDDLMTVLFKVNSMKTEVERTALGEVKQGGWRHKDTPYKTLFKRSRETFGELCFWIIRQITDQIMIPEKQIAFLQKSMRSMINCYEEKIITIDEISELYIYFLEHMSKLYDSGDVQDFELLEQITQDYISDFCDKMGVVKSRTNEAFALSSKKIEYFEKIVQYYEMLFNRSHGGIEILQGKIFWISLYLAFNNSSLSSVDYYVEEFLDQGHEIVKEKINRNILTIYQNKVYSIRRQTLWDFNKIITKEFHRFGVINKLVLLSRLKFENITIEFNVKEHRRKHHESYFKDYIYKISNCTQSIYYLTPLVDDSEDPIKLADIVKMSDLTKTLYKALIKCRWNKDKIYSWYEFLTFLSKECDIDLNPYFNSSVSNQLENDVSAAEFMIKNIEEKALIFNYKEIQQTVYVKYGEFTSKDTYKLTKYEYENKFSNNDVYLQITRSAQKMKGYSLPRNPSQLASILNEFEHLRKNNVSITFNEFKNQKIRNIIGIKNSDIQFRCMLYIYKIPLTGKNKRDPNWMNKTIDFGLYERFNKIDDLLNRIKEQIEWERFERRKRDYLAPFNKELVKCYFDEVKKRLIR